MEQIIFHIDVNSAYLSWTAVEQLKNGAEVDLRTIPAIIGGNQESRHGVVLANLLWRKIWDSDRGAGCTGFPKMSGSCDGAAKS